jgi:hypothetical protein
VKITITTSMFIEGGPGGVGVESAPVDDGVVEMKNATLVNDVDALLHLRLYLLVQQMDV